MYRIILILATVLRAAVTVTPENPEPYHRIEVSVPTPEVSADATVTNEWQYSDGINDAYFFGKYNERALIWANPGTHQFTCRTMVIDWTAKTFSSEVHKGSVTVGKSPTPVPPPVIGKSRYIVIVRESLNEPQWLVKLINEFRSGKQAKYLLDNKHTLHIVDPDAKNDPALKAVGTIQRSLPAVYVLDRTTNQVLGSNDVPKTAEALEQYIRSFE